MIRLNFRTLNFNNEEKYFLRWVHFVTEKLLVFFMNPTNQQAHMRMYIK